MPKAKAQKPVPQEPRHLVDLKICDLPRITGLDLSLNRTGWAVTDSVKAIGISYGIFDSEDRHGAHRLAHIRNLVKQLVVSGGDPERNLILIENYAFGKTNQAHQMGELGGVIRLMLFEEGYEFFVIPPTRLKKFLTGKGVADKNIILKEVFKRWKFDVDDDNVADALVLMQLGLALVGKLENTTAFQEAVVQEVLKDLSKVEE